MVEIKSIDLGNNEKMVFDPPIQWDLELLDICEGKTEYTIEIMSTKS